MKNIGNDPRSLFNGNYFSSYRRAKRAVFNDQTRDIYIIGERAMRARRYLVMFMETRDIFIIYIRYTFVCF